MTSTSHFFARLLALTLALLLPVQGWAEPTPTRAEPTPIRAEPATVEQALEKGDLTSAQDLAVANRTKAPSDADAWRVEAEVHERAGDLSAAIEARRGQAAALPKGAEERAHVQHQIARLQEQSRGTVADEPASTHRETLDARRGLPSAAANPKAAAAPKADPPRARDRIVRKWYFWVTMAAIVASAGAITGIAIKAATSERSDALDSQVAGGGVPPPVGPALLRF